MDRDLALSYLAGAAKVVAKSEQRIDCQLAVISALCRSGRDYRRATELLEMYLELLQEYKAYRALLLKEINGKPPPCIYCGVPMWLARFEPLKRGGDKRTFECPACKQTRTEIVEY